MNSRYAGRMRAASTTASEPQCGRNAELNRTDLNRSDLSSLSLGRRVVLPTVDESLKAVDVREGERLVTLGQAIASGVWPDGQRHKVTRRGDREPIPNHLRSAVWFRDKGRCELCGTGERLSHWELDHITPWSAGGSDTSDNLRVLCVQHNQERGNHIDPTERPRMPVTWWCVNCYSPPGDDEREWIYFTNGSVECPKHRYPLKSCRVAQGYRRTFDAFGELPTWHEQETYVASPAVVAFCAHCNIPALTDKPL